MQFLQINTHAINNSSSSSDDDADWELHTHSTPTARAPSVRPPFKPSRVMRVFEYMRATTTTTATCMQFQTVTVAAAAAEWTVTKRRKGD